MGRILIVDDDGYLRGIVRDVLKEEGFSPVEAADGSSALKLFEAERPDAVLLDLEMPGMKGIDTMRELRKIDPHVPVIILTGHGDIPTAVTAIKAGAYDFAEKPPEFEKLAIMLRRAVERRMLELEIEKVNTALGASLEDIFGRSEAVKTVIRQIRQVAQTNFAVIIQGETGTGKSVIANTIKSLSKRSEHPFVSVDMGLIPDSLVESELFGYKKGAFTGAERDRVGYFESAHCGTIFIDELENMSPYMQAKLLSVIEKKRVYPLGCAAPYEVDIRIIAATNKDIRESVRKKEFREDLFYRLGEFIITMPPLRDRIEDIPFFAYKFVLEAAAELNKQIRGISDGAADVLAGYSWPGNIRELKNVMRRGVLITDSDCIERKHIELLFGNQQVNGADSPSLPLKEELKDIERRRIQEALEKAEGNRTRAAEILQVSHKTLLEKIKKYGFDQPSTM